MRILGFAGFIVINWILGAAVWHSDMNVISKIAVTLVGFAGVDHLYYELILSRQ